MGCGLGLDVPNKVGAGFAGIEARALSPPVLQAKRVAPFPAIRGHHATKTKLFQRDAILRVSHQCGLGRDGVGLGHRQGKGSSRFAQEIAATTNHLLSHHGIGQVGHLLLLIQHALTNLLAVQLHHVDDSVLQSSIGGSSRQQLGVPPIVLALGAAGKNMTHLIGVVVFADAVKVAHQLLSLLDALDLQATPPKIAVVFSSAEPVGRSGGFGLEPSDLVAFVHFKGHSTAGDGALAVAGRIPEAGIFAVGVGVDHQARERLGLRVAAFFFGR